MGSIFGAISNKFSRKKKKQQPKIEPEEEKQTSQKIKGSQKLKYQKEPAKTNQKSAFDGIDHSKISDEKKKELDEIDEDLNQISNLLGNLKQIGLEQNSELERHSKMLDEIDTKVDKANYMIDQNNRKIRKML
eukprot:Anaeramoba_ignava/c15443_g1_i1.p1 GENE.c15443_g1_i1~~c15443_g1_i1.p1  ORF type:complete len:133 (-),score=61.45 c15443_g1_i1:29-427(-)